MLPKRGIFHKKKIRRQRNAASPRRAFVAGLASILLAAGLFAAVIRPLPARAQWTVIDPAVLSQLIAKQAADRAKNILDKIADFAVKAAKKVADVAYKSGLRVFLGKIAEDTATWVASGGKGQGPLFITDPHYFRDLGNAAAGDFLDTLSKDQFGVSMCDPGIAKLQIDVALRVNLDPNFCQENCQKNYDVGKNSQTVTIKTANGTAGTTDLETLRRQLTFLNEKKAKGVTVTAGAPLCTAFGLTDRVDECIVALQKHISEGELALQSDLKLCIKKCTNAKNRRTTSCTLSAITTNVQNGLSQSGVTINTPLGSGAATGASLQESFEKGDLPTIFKPTANPLGQFLTFYDEAQEAKVEAERNEKALIDLSDKGLPLRSLISGAVKSPGFLTKGATQEGLSIKQSTEAELKQTGSPIADAFGIFTNTLTNKLIERIFNKGIADPKAKSLAFNTGILSSSTGGVAAAKERFASLGQVNFGTGGGIDILNELSACPIDVSNSSSQTPSPVSPYNCAIDASFRQAVEERLTVKQALERKLLSDQKVFGFDANGREPDFRSGYPYRSLKILRKYRMIPVGWELAAEYIRDFERQNVNLGAIVGQFDNPDSPYYRLVDPSWVLKAPENICLRSGFTSDVVSQEYVDVDGDEGGKKNVDYSKRYCNTDSDANVGKECNCSDGTATADTTKPACISSYRYLTTAGKGQCAEEGSDGSLPNATCAFITPREQQIQRREACVAEQTCILENDDGTCKQFGTCTQEKDTWRFNGQSCSNVYASCQTFTDTSGQTNSYLKSTLQPDSCGPDNAGCQQYCTSYDYAASKWTCTNNNITNTVRFDRDAQECDANAEGCTQFIRMSTGTNLIGNGNFEQSTIINPANNASFSGWRTGDTTQTCGAQTFASSQAFGGGQAARLQELPACGGGDAARYFTTTQDTGIPLRDRTFTVSFYAKSEGATCTIDTEITTGNEYSPSTSPSVTPEWQRFSYTYTFTTAEASRSAFTLFFRPTAACTYLIDNVQVEEGSQLTDYKDYGTVNQAHLKRAPDALGCTGNPATDPVACSKFISKCTAGDVGCDLFTPTAGGAPVPAKGGISCPADKVGCATFREQPTVGVLRPHETRTGKYCQSKLQAPDFSFVSCTDDTQCGGTAGDCQPLVSFIAKTGTQCTAQDVGCEAFTNLDEVAKGGEGKAQFTKLQLCVQPGHTGLRSFYSWVGDNESGYQLKQDSLVVSNITVAGETGPGPCTNLQSDLPLNCVDTAATVATCTAAEFGTNLDCGQYYDENGQVHYRLRSRIIAGTADCHPYRNTVDNTVYYADSVKSLSCTPAAVGCREYVGNTGSNVRTLLKSDFENGSYAPWVVTNAANPSNESVVFGGHSLNVTGSRIAQTSSIVLTRGRTYTLSFWAKGAAATTINANLQATGGVDMGTVNIGTDWNTYTLGPSLVDFDTTGANGLVITGGGNFFIDNIVLTELTDSTYRVKTSQTACGGFEGCQEYRNRNNQVATYAGFTKLCKSEVVGCEALINTHNSTDAYASTTSFPSQRGDVDGSGRVDNADVDYLVAYLFIGGPAPVPLAAGDADADGGLDIGDTTTLVDHLNNGTPISSSPYPGDTIVTPRDTVEFFVNDPAKACRAEEKGCRAVGKQNFEANGDLLSMTTTYLQDNPDTYDSIMCGRGALFCEEFTTTDNGKAYFRNPGNKVCNYRDASGNKSAGWYIVGTDTPCPVRELNKIPPAVPNGGFAGLCPAEQNGCGNFLDPLGTGSSITANGSFEVANNLLPQGWTSGTCATNPAKQCASDADCTTGSCTQSGSVKAYSPNNNSQAVRVAITNQGTFTQTISLSADTYYVISADVTRGDATMTDSFRLGVTSCKNAQGNTVGVSSPDNSLVSDAAGANIRIVADRFSDVASTRMSARFYSGTAVTCNVIVGATTGNVGYWIDNVNVLSTTNTSVIRQSVDSSSCNGQVGDKLGCHLFNDLSTPALAYDADQSPVSGSPTDPDAVGSPASCADHPELCDSNVLLKVQRDRSCSQWIAPTTTIESTKPNGQKENLTIGLATCDSFSPSGQCDHFVDELRCSNKPKQTCLNDADCGGGVCKPMPLTGNTQAYSREDLRNKSGLVVAGLQWASNQLVRGKFPFGVAPQIGNDGVAVPNEILNGNFSNSKTLNNSGWVLGPISSNDGSNIKLVTSQTLQTGNAIAPVEVNPYLELTPNVDGTATTTLQTADSTLADRLTPGSTYMLSFSVRYAQAAAADVPDTALSAGIATSTQDGIVANNAWFGKVTPTTTMQRFVVGPLKLSQGATLNEGNISGSNHKPFDPNTGIVYFSLAGANRTPIIIDDVSVLPTLHVDDPLPANTGGIVGQPNGAAYVARTCRAYPNSTALDCSYTDDTGKRFDGWQGYCLEPDPRNPNVCLSWYPVDLLSGERNIFGRVEAAGYSDKAPLYMCLQATGNYNKPANFSYQGGGRAAMTTFDNQIVNEFDNGDRAFRSPLLGKSFGYRRPAVTVLRGSARAFLPQIPGNPGALCRATRWPGVCGEADAACDDVAALTAGSDTVAVSAGDTYQKDEIEKIVLLFQAGESGHWVPSSGRSSCYKGDGNLGCTYFGPTPDGQVYLTLDHNAEGKCWNANCWTATWAGPVESDNANYITFTVTFDPNTKRITHFSFSSEDGSCGGGFAASVMFYLREQCTEVVKVVDTSGKNASWSSNVTSTGYALPNYKYKLSQEDRPYGSIAPPAETFEDPFAWDGRGTLLDGKQPLDVQQNSVSARAGSAYACPDVSDSDGRTGNCGGRQCFGLPASSLRASGASYSCDTVLDIQKCVSAGGYCNGFGTAKLCVAGPKASAANPTACTSNTECGANGLCDYAGSYCSVATGSVRVGSVCTQSADCGVGGVCTTFSNTTGGVYATRKTDTVAIDRLKLIFANAYGAWRWSGTQYDSQDSLVTNWQNAYANMQLCNGGSLDRGLAETDPTRAYCGMLPSVANVAVGTQEKGDVIIGTGEVIQLKFNSLVDTQQLPLDQIAIDWDGNEESDEIIPWGFAPRSDQTDKHSITHVYRAGLNSGTCYGKGTLPYGNPRLADGTANPDYKPQLANKEYCVATPQIQIKDNWQYCNGDTANPRRCLNEFPVRGDSNYWEPYPGNIIVVR